jgi:hypothetical protein
LESFMRAALLAVAAICALAAPALAQPHAAAAPVAPAALDAQLLAQCGADGGKAAECRCGLGVARDTLSPRELALFPVLWPIVNQKGDIFAKLTLGRAAAAAAGYSEQEAMQTVLKVAQTAPAVEKKCKAPQAPAAPPPAPIKP